MAVSQFYTAELWKISQGHEFHKDFIVAKLKNQRNGRQCIFIFFGCRQIAKLKCFTQFILFSWNLQKERHTRMLVHDQNVYAMYKMKIECIEEKILLYNPYSVEVF